MSRELKIENQLDSHLKQVKVGETATPIEISTEKIRMNKDLICVENIEVEGGFNLNSRQIQFPDQIVLESSEFFLLCGQELMEIQAIMMLH